MSELKGTKTEQNLMEAFAGESMARNKYTYYASQARKDGYEQIAEAFLETAHNEMAHAKIWYKLLNNGIGTTKDNLLAAAGGEHFEWEEMYARMAKEAKDEGFDEIARLFAAVGKIEKVHEERYLALAKNIEQEQVFAKPEVNDWYCINCGHISHNTAAPKLCPVCAHPQSFFQVKATNY
ncbi:MAG: rubrerythrin family protein [Defluviitaleaceae bacterium]|nr:rubrerythrin family protein [Defluviitaleaceae bacterium]